MADQDERERLAQIFDGAEHAAFHERGGHLQLSAADCAFIASLLRELHPAPPDALMQYRDPMNGGAVEFCGDCGAPCVVVRPGKTQCQSCDWWKFAPESPFVNARPASGETGP